MEELRLHKQGRKDFLKSQKEKLNDLKKLILKNHNLSDTEKEIKLKKIDESYESEKVNSMNSLF